MSSNNEQSQSEILKVIRGDINESRNLTIKTDNLVKNLSADIRQIGRRQEAFEKRFVFNSVMAYILFSVLVFAGLYLAFQSQVAKERDAVVAAQQRAGELQTRVLELEKELERRRSAEEDAYALFRLMEEKKQDEALEAFPAVRGKIVNRAERELLTMEIARINRSLALSAFEVGTERHKAKDYEGARDAFLKSLAHVEKAHYTPTLHYRLGMSFFFLGEFESCVTHLRQALEVKHDKNTMNSAVWHLAVALDKLGRAGEARTAYEVYARRFAYHERAPVAQKRVFEFIRQGIRAEGTVAGMTGASNDK